MADIEELQASVRQFCDDRDWVQFHNPKELSIGLVTEAAELLQLFRFLKPDQMTAMLNDDTARSAIEEELADSLYFILLFADEYGFDLASLLEDKLAKNALRYPVESSHGDNRKRPHA